MSINSWYPGHVNKARRKIKDLLKQSNAIILVLDSRAPYSSMAFEEFKFLKSRNNVLILLNKSDLADDEKTVEWKNFFFKKGFKVMPFSMKNPIKRKTIIDLLKVKDRLTKLMIMGIPNVGKSTILNYLAGRKSAQTANKAGVTRGIQWIRLDDTTLLLDTPGVLYANISNEDLFTKLFYIKAINVDKIDIVEFSCKLIEFLRNNYPDRLKKIFDSDLDPYKYLTELSKEKKFFLKGSLPDLERAAFYIYNSTTNGKLGKITYEKVTDEFVK
jgi:ribosome biogenesis GTPase A